MDNSYSKENLQEINHSGLRKLAATFGVASPTSKKKDVLIEEIIAIQEGRLQPAKPSNRGRPKKKELEDTISQKPQTTQNELECVMNTTFQSNLEVTPTIETAEPSTAANEDFDTAIIENDTDYIVKGVLEIIMPDGYGFLRTNNFYTSDEDVFVPLHQIRRFMLRNGDLVECKARSYNNLKRPSAIYIFNVNGKSCDKLFKRPIYEELKPTYPDQRIRLEGKHNSLDFALRAIDLVAPIGMGQRGLIVSPPKAGKTILLKKLAQAISKNYPELKLIILLIDERPEEVTDMMESVDAEVVYSTFDMQPEHHTSVAELVMKNAKRRVEYGENVVILLDSLTRLARAYNHTADQSGRTLSGGLDINALFEPKKFFGAARKIRDGGSLTIIATALVDTGSRMDDVIYEEFKGTGNMEIHLDRRMSERRIFPAIDLNRSGTRREDLLLEPKELEAAWLIRKMLGSGNTIEATEQLLEMLTRTKNNDSFIAQLRLLQMRN